MLDAVASLGYHPNQGARSLRSRRTRQFAYVLPRVQLFPGNYIMQQFLQSLAAASARRGYSMVIVVPDRDPREDIHRLIASRSVDAFLLSELQPDDPRVVLLSEAGMPFASFGRTGPALPQNWVDIDNRAAAATVVEHVLARGFRRIAFLGYRSANHWDTERAAGFTDGLAARGIAADPAGMLLLDDTSARRKIRSLLSASLAELRPDAIVTGSDRLAGVVYSVAAELRLRIGQDLAVTGFDGSAAAAMMHPRLTSVAIPVDDIARRVVARALKQVDHGPDHDPGEVVPTKLRLGESTGGFGRDASRADERAGQAGEHAGAEQGRALEGPPTRRGNVPALTWKRFQEASVSTGTSTLQGGELAAESPPGLRPGWGPPSGGSPSRTWPPTPGWVSARSRECSTEASRCASPPCARCLTRIDRLGYRPSHAAAALVRGTPRTVALMVAHLTRPSTVVRVASALAVLEEQGYDAIVYNVDSPTERDRHLEALLPTHRADGVRSACRCPGQCGAVRPGRSRAGWRGRGQRRGAADGDRRRGRRPWRPAT